MIASPSETNSPNDKSKVQEAFDAALQQDKSDAGVPDAVPFNAVLGAEVARKVMAGKRRARAEGERVTVTAAPEDMEPEEIGGKGSRQRRCIVTGTVHSSDEMIRFALDPQGVVTPDLEGRLPGRGYWVTARHNELYRAANGEVFARAARGKVTVPAGLVDLVISLVRKSCLNTLGLARRSWDVEFGYDNVRQALLARKLGLVLIARNAPVELQHRLDPVLADVPVVDLFTTADLSAALGRDSLVYAGVCKGQWTLRLITECRRLAQLIAP